jgi:hypothetical protein
MTTQTHKWLPSEPTNEMVKGLETVLSNLRGLHESQDYYGNEIWLLEEIDIVMDVIKKLQAAPEVEQDPSVYLVWHDGEFTYTKQPEEIKNAYETLPLYTHPQPKRELLSEDEVFGIAEVFLSVDEDGGRYEVIFDYDLVSFTRAIEKTHGIGVE